MAAARAQRARRGRQPPRNASALGPRGAAHGLAPHRARARALRLDAGALFFVLLVLSSSALFLMFFFMFFFMFCRGSADYFLFYFTRVSAPFFLRPRRRRRCPSVSPRRRSSRTTRARARSCLAKRPPRSASSSISCSSAGCGTTCRGSRRTGCFRTRKAAAEEEEAQLGMRWDELGWDGVWGMGNGTGGAGGWVDVGMRTRCLIHFTSPLIIIIIASRRPALLLFPVRPPRARASAAVVEALGSGLRTGARQRRRCWFTRAGEAGRLGLEER